jgi:hypothetical protein
LATLTLHGSLSLSLSLVLTLSLTLILTLDLTWVAQLRVCQCCNSTAVLELLLPTMLTICSVVQTLQMPVSEDVEELRRRLENALLRNMMQDREATPLFQQNGYHVSTIRLVRAATHESVLFVRTYTVFCQRGHRLS